MALSLYASIFGIIPALSPLSRLEVHGLTTVAACKETRCLAPQAKCPSPW